MEKDNNTFDDSHVKHIVHIIGMWGLGCVCVISFFVCLIEVIKLFE